MSDETRTEIDLPYQFQPRTYQMPMCGVISAGYRRYIGVWHRRAGKDKTAFAGVIIPEAMKVKANYYYILPTYSQGRKIVWEGIDPRTGLKFLDHIPEELIKKINNTEMKIELVNGSIIQIIGSDNYDSIMGTPPFGCIFSEYSLQDPRAWDFIRPILRENGGWAMFIYTPRGWNHGRTLFKMAETSLDWYTELYTVDTTLREDGTPVISKEDIEKDRAEGMDDDLINQEYYCSFEGAVQGSYYGKQLSRARKDKRITVVPYSSEIPVDTYWDLGMDDSMTIWFIQPVVHREIRVIDYYEFSGEGFEHYAKILKERDYNYGTHFMPHDVEIRELGTGKTRKDVAEKMGIKPIETIPRARDMDAVNLGIEAGRNILSRCYFDADKCLRGLAALESYSKEWDEKNKVFKNRPRHDWASHGADSWRTFAVGFQEALDGDIIKKLQNNQKKDWSPI